MNAARSSLEQRTLRGWTELARTLRWGFYVGQVWLSLLCVRGATDIHELRVQTQPGAMIQKKGIATVIKQGQLPRLASPPLPLNLGDTLTTSNASSAVVFLRDGSPVRMKELTRLELQPRPGDTNLPRIFVSAGELYWIHHLDPQPGSPRTKRHVRFITPQLEGTLSGTEFLLSVDPNGNRTDVTMFDGQATLVTLAERGTVTVEANQQATAITGQGISVQSAVLATNLVQWWIYYPAVLDPAELGLGPVGEGDLVPSLRAYRSGDLHGALETFPGYPIPTPPQTDPERIYLAALFLAAGAVDRAELQLTRLSDTNVPAVRALRTMLAAVGARSSRTDALPAGSTQAWSFDPQLTASELLALSFVYQSRRALPLALDAVKESVVRSTNFAFGWARLAELEFSFRHVPAARAALERALALAPRHAPAHSLRGFLLAADDRTRDALEAFDQAIALDSALGNAWLGRGLCKRRLSLTVFEFGHRESKTQNPKSKIGDWLSDLQTAALLEPTRSLVHSYVGKAFTDVGELVLAHKELAYAKRLDPNDPTPWLYSALLNREDNRINEAVRDLERSIELNDNRAAYRSEFLLDEDRAVRSSSLANLYDNAGLNDAAVGEAARAVSHDYANYSAHLFLSETYNARRDPARFNLRYETTWFSELLLANLLSPVGGTPLSQHISQQEYSRLFDRSRIGLRSDFSYRSDGQYHELASKFGVIGKTAWSIDLDYQQNEGVRPNNELDRIEWSTTFKQQVTAQDSLLLLAGFQDYHSGDNFQYYDPGQARHHFSYDEEQSPSLLVGYHREWTPGIHTLGLGGRLEDAQQFSDRQTAEAILYRDSIGQVVALGTNLFDVLHRNELEIFTSELSQVFQAQPHTLVLGGRFQTGEFSAHSLLTNPAVSSNLFASPHAASTRTLEDFRRASAYAYYTLELPTRLRLTGGFSYDDLLYPQNFRSPPVNDGEETRSQLSPKAALVWNPIRPLTWRGIYAQSLGGASLDESFRLEPTQLAGFPQAFRTIIPESLIGSVAAPMHEIAGLGLDLKLSGTHTGVQAERLKSQVRQSVGVFDYNDFVEPIVAGSTRQKSDYEEHGLSVYLNQLLGRDWSAGAKYRFTRSRLNTRFPEIPNFLATPHRDQADLHETILHLAFNHPSGFFALAQSRFYSQRNALDSANLPDDSFFQIDLQCGYRFPRQRGQVAVGVLNLNDTDYRLNPVTPYQELPRERVFVTRISLNF